MDSGTLVFISLFLRFHEMTLLYPFQQSCEGYSVFDPSVSQLVLFFCSATPLNLLHGILSNFVGI